MQPRNNKAHPESVLQNAHTKLSDTLRHSLADYAQKMVWDENGEVTPPKESDPALVQLAKHCLFALQEAETVARGANEVLNRYQRGGVKGVILDEILGVMPSIAAAGQPPSQEEKEAERITQGIDAYHAAQQLYTHLQAIAKIAAAAELPQDVMTQLASAAHSLFHLSPQAILNSEFSNLGEVLSNLMTTYLETNRPTAPAKPEQEYEAKEEIACELIDNLPNDFSKFKPNSYLLIKASEKNWELIYLDERRNPYLVHIDDVPKLRQILGKKSLFQLNDEDRKNIQANLALRWNPRAQERGEWLVLIEPLRSALSGTKKLHELLKNFTDDAEKRGITLDPTQVDFIERTEAALKKSTIDQDGYYNYLEDGQETPLSQNVKAIFNVIWATNQLAKGYWENPGAEAHLQLIKHSQIALNHYWKIRWPSVDFQITNRESMVENYEAITDQLINAMLIYGKDMAFEKLEQLAQSTHEVEFRHNLRFGFLLENMRPLFDNLESVYQERNLGVFTNPLGYSEKTRMQLEEKLQEAKKEEKKYQQEFNFFNEITEKLKWYNEFAKDISQPSLAGERYGTLPLIETLEEKAQSLLFDLLIIKQFMPLSEDERMAIDNLENRLLSDLTLEKKRTLLKAINDKIKESENNNLLNLRKKILKAIGENKRQLEEKGKQGYLKRGLEIARKITAPSPSLQKPWPQAELDLLIKITNCSKKESQEKLLDIERYTEALDQHKKMQKEFALRTLKNDGLIALIEAAKQSHEDSRINLGKKRKLVGLLADIRGESRPTSLTRKEVSSLASTFAASPQQIKIFIQQVYEIDPSLGHALAIEATLANYTDFELDDPILKSHDKNILRKDLINALSRLETKQVLAMLSKNLNDTPSKQATILIELFEKTLENRIHLDIEQLRLTPENFIQFLVDYYGHHALALEQAATTAGKSLDTVWKLNHPERETMNKIGLFLGRLAHEDTAMANLIFANAHASKIVKQECLLEKTNLHIKGDRALYFESLVKIFSFNYKEGAHEKENRDFLIFLEDNKNVVLEIYKALNPDTALDNEKIIEIYKTKEGQNKLMILLETFTKTCLSPGSDAEMKLREFFSAMLLCKNSSFARGIVLELQKEAFGSSQAKYLELLTVEASYAFWHQVKEDLMGEPHKILIDQVESMTQTLRNAILDSEMLASQKTEALEKIERLLEMKKLEAANAMKTLTTVVDALKIKSPPLARKKDISVECRLSLQEIDKIKQEVERQYQEWMQDIQLLSVRQANLNNLDKQLSNIETILEDYLSTFGRGEKLTELQRTLGDPLPKKKRELVLTYLEKFREIKSEAKKTPADYEGLASLAVALGHSLAEDHEKLLKVRYPNTTQLNQGKLGTAIARSQSIFSADNDHLSTEDFQKPLSRISRIIADIRATLSRRSASFFSASPRTPTASQNTDMDYPTPRNKSPSRP
ncbi:MAG: hypothetical protein K0S27_1264 [Gammaproteobacteria bacterium]|jgi:hypothetical protein|nr:hypothetical protein [Gammaproteobacteria bacterium]